MLRSLLIVLALCTASLLYGQELLVASLASPELKSQKIDKENSIQPGFYRSLAEVRSNTPTVEWKDREIESRFHDYGWNRNMVELHVLDIRRSEARQIGKVWGFSDGENVYVHRNIRSGENRRLPKFRSRTRFAKLSIYGDYGYFEDINYIVIPFQNGAPLIIPQIERQVIDMNTGKIRQITIRRLKKLIASDTELLAEFKDESGKRRKLKKYLAKFAERN